MAKKVTYTITVDGTTFGNLISLPACIELAVTVLQHRKSVIVRNNVTRRTEAHFIYGHRQ